MEKWIFMKINWVIPMIFVSNFHYKLFHSVMWEQPSLSILSNPQKFISETQ